MALKLNRQMSDKSVFAKTASIGATPAIAYTVAPWNGKIVATFAVCEGAATGTIAVAVAINGGANIGALSLTGGAGIAGSNIPAVPGVSKTVQEGDVISFTPSGGAGATIPGTFCALIRKR